MINPSPPAPRPTVLPPLARPALVPPMRYPAAGPARLRRRHLGLIATFAALVLAPALISAWYLWARAADQYASYVGFSVRKEETSSAIEMLGGLASLSGSSSGDTDILYDYMFSPGLVAEIDAEVDLRAIWSKAGHDPLFAYAPPGTIEDLVDHWRRKVRVTYDSGTRLIELRVLAFDPDDARRVAAAILAKSGAMINRLSAIARDDTIRYARDDLARAQAQLTDARLAMTDFRNRTQIVDPTTDVQSQTGLLGKLQEQLADALITVDMMSPTMRDGDLRLAQARTRVSVIETRIAAERRKLGLGEDGGKGTVYATLMGDYEHLASDLQFAEQSQAAARAAYDAAQAEARRQGRYLAAHIAPTRAESARFPQRWTLLSVITVFLFLTWATCALIYYALRDRR